MKALTLALCLILTQANVAIAQDLPGLSYCLLFDSSLEKEAFSDSDKASSDPIIFLLANDPKFDSIEYQNVKEDVLDFSRKLETKKGKFKNEGTFLNYVFQKAHQRYLRNYKYSETFAGIFNDGSYNCVSGTALYACILNQLGYAPEIYETRYHIFLKVTTTDSVSCLFEATDPFSGFEHKKDRIELRVKKYLENERTAILESESISAPFNSEIVFKRVSLFELTGLHYYNIAVDLINRENYYDAFRALKKASILYPASDRIKDFLEFTKLKHEAELSEAFVGN